LLYSRIARHLSQHFLKSNQEVMQIKNSYRIPAILCAFAVVVSDLLAHPVANMGMIDDSTYVPIVRTLAATGHIAYNNWGAGTLGWQLYLAAIFVKLFGFSFTVVRSSTIFVAAVMAFALQRTLVRAGITERYATLGTLTLVLSPMYLMLSTTFMSDITGLFGIVLCVYGCLRALQSNTDRTMIAWLCFAVITNAVFGSSRQISWLGILVMIPSTLWLLRARRRVLFAGAIAALAGAVFIFASLHWLNHQPHTLPEHINLRTTFPIHFLMELMYFLMDAPFFLIPALVLFLPELRKVRRGILFAVSALIVPYLFLGVYPSHLRGHFRLGPIGECTSSFAMFAFPGLQGTPPGFLPLSICALLTLLAVGGLLGLFTSLRQPASESIAPLVPIAPTWHQLRILLVPFSIIYTFLICQRGVAFEMHDRYLLCLLFLAVLCLFRYDQEHASPRFPIFSGLLITVIAVYSVLANHQMFAFYRARVDLASELLANGVPPTSVDSGWEYNFGVELQYADHIQTPGAPGSRRASIPAPTPADACAEKFADYTPHIHPLYGVSFEPTACYGPAPFAPVHYSRWPHRDPGTLYVVRYSPAPTP
jgi:hypothetical protein